jgi:Tetratricopeptide repeat
MSLAAKNKNGAIPKHQRENSAQVVGLSRAIECFPKAYFLRGLAHARQGDFEPALADCNLSISLEPANVQAYLLRSIVYHCLGKVERALADYQRVLEIDPQSILKGLNHSLADGARAQITERLAEFIDGVVPEPPSIFPLRTQVKEVEPQSAESLVAEPAQHATLESEPVPLPPVRKSARSPAKSLPPAEAMRVPNSDPAAAKTRPLASPPPAEKKSPSPVTCPLCKYLGPGTEELAGGRIRCANCEALFIPAKKPDAARPSAPTRQLPQKIAKETPKSKEAGSFARKWQRPLPLTAVGIVALAAIFLMFPKNLFGKSNRLPVVAAEGKVSFQGKATPGAVVFLHPVGVKDLNHPTPRGTVAADGTFVLGTYAENDGAPIGAYKATVQWFTKVENPEKDDGVMPRNQLPAKYARAETSGLSVHIQEGENKIPTILLTR